MLKTAAAELIRSNREIVSAFSDESADERYWKIKGFAQVPCGGTHLRRTSEIGKIALKRKNIGRGKERIEVLLDDKNA